MHETIRRLSLAIYGIDEVYFLNEKKLQISDSEFYLAYILDDGKPHSQKGISSALLFSKSTVNTVAKRWEKEGYIIQTPIPGKRREMQIFLTESGKEYIKTFMPLIYKAEDAAMKKTLERYSSEFVDAIEYFGKCLREVQEQQVDSGD